MYYYFAVIACLTIAIFMTKYKFAYRDRKVLVCFALLVSAPILIFYFGGLIRHDLLKIAFWLTFGFLFILYLFWFIKLLNRQIQIKNQGGNHLLK